jgi:CRP-like cAMP-binding protein
MGTRHHHAKQRISELRDLDIFSGCTQRQLRLVDQLGTTLPVPCDRVLCRRGTIAREAFVVARGFATATVCGQFVAAVGKGDVIADAALGSAGVRHTASIVAASDMTVIVYNRAEFASLLNAADTVAHKVYRQIADRLSLMTEPLLEECRPKGRRDEAKIAGLARHGFENEGWCPPQRSRLRGES